jgi:hypothetical protein
MFGGRVFRDAAPDILGDSPDYVERRRKSRKAGGAGV